MLLGAHLPPAPPPRSSGAVGSAQAGFPNPAKRARNRERLLPAAAEALGWRIWGRWRRLAGRNMYQHGKRSRPGAHRRVQTELIIQAGPWDVRGAPPPLAAASRPLGLNRAGTGIPGSRRDLSHILPEGRSHLGPQGPVSKSPLSWGLLSGGCSAPPSKRLSLLKPDLPSLPWHPCPVLPLATSVKEPPSVYCARDTGQERNAGPS